MNGIIVHEWLEPLGGAERVVDALVKFLPISEILTLWNDDSHRYTDLSVRETWIAKTFFRKNKTLSLPILPLVWRTTRIKNVEWMIVSSHLFAHHFKPSESIKNLVYVHSPARYIWEPELDERGDSPFVRAVSPIFKYIDKHSAKKHTSIAANSEFVRKRIERVWERESRVIYPPVMSREISSTDWSNLLTVEEQHRFFKLPQTYLLAASRLVTYKKIDEAIKFSKLVDLPLVVAGDGPDKKRLEEYSKSLGSRVIFLGKVSDAFLHNLYAGALAYIFPAIEDFGIMPVEAMANGTPVIGSIFGGGVLETVIPGKSGLLFNFEDHESIRNNFSQIENISKTSIREHSYSFDVTIFNESIKNWLNDNGIELSINAYEN